MSIRSFCLGTFLAIFLVFWSCTTALPSRQSPESCLIVMKVELLSSPSLPMPRKYCLHFTPDFPAQEVPNSTGFVAFVINQPNVVISSYTSTVDSNYAAVGAESYNKANISLPYLPGRMIILDLGIQREYQKRAGGGMDYFRFYRMSTDEKNDFRKELKEKMKNNGWDFDNLEPAQSQIF